MSERNTVIRSLHDLGLAAWFGGSMAGAVAVNGAAADLPDPTTRPHGVGAQQLSGRVGRTASWLRPTA
jgi:hypothetical protein